MRGFVRTFTIFILVMSASVGVPNTSTANTLVLDDLLVTAERNKNAVTEVNGSISLKYYGVLEVAKAFTENPGTEINFDIDFAENSIVPTADGRGLVDTLALVIRYIGKNYEFKIIGHTGTQGNRVLKDRLSRQRAEAVAALLSNNHGIANEIRTEGVADTRLLRSRSGMSDARISIISGKRGG